MRAGPFVCPFDLTLTVLTSSSSFLLWSVAHSHPIVPPFPSISAREARDAASLLPAQVGGILGAYGVSLVLVLIALLTLSKRRREHLDADDDAADTNLILELARPPQPLSDHYKPPPLIVTPTNVHHPYGLHEDPCVPYSPLGSIAPIPAPGLAPSVDQKVVAADKIMAQQQLEDMYRHVMEHEDAKARGVLHTSTSSFYPVSSSQPAAPEPSEKPTGGFFRKARHKPNNLDVEAAKEDRSQSKASAMFSALLSPKKKPSMRGLSISSPIMTPKATSFAHHFDSQEMDSMTPRHYAPAPAPLSISNGLSSYGGGRIAPNPATVSAPDISPESAQSIDERLGLALDRRGRNTPQAPNEFDPGSAVSEHSQAPLIGLPASPRLGGFPTLPASPKPGATFRRPTAPSAVRTNGTLPLRAYQEADGAPSVVGQTTKQTVFERRGPLSPGGMQTPLTANPVPYTPYQPFTPCIPVTPSLVTKEDRKRMRKMVPKTPTLSMVQSSDEMW